MSRAAVAGMEPTVPVVMVPIPLPTFTLLALASFSTRTGGAWAQRGRVAPGYDMRPSGKLGASRDFARAQETCQLCRDNVNSPAPRRRRKIPGEQCIDVRIGLNPCGYSDRAGVRPWPCCAGYRRKRINLSYLKIGRIIARGIEIKEYDIAVWSYGQAMTINCRPSTGDPNGSTAGKIDRHPIAHVGQCDSTGRRCITCRHPECKCLPRIKNLPSRWCHGTHGYRNATSYVGYHSLS